MTQAPDSPPGWFTITEAAEVTGVSRSTVRRRLDGGEFPGARQDEGDPRAPWLIPQRDLVTAGLATTKPETTQSAGPGQRTGADQAAEVERLRAEVERLRRELDRADALAEERAARIEDLKAWNRWLGTGQDDPTPQNAPGRRESGAPPSPHPAPGPGAARPAQRDQERRSEGGGLVGLVRRAIGGT